MEVRSELLLCCVTEIFIAVFLRGEPILANSVHKPKDTLTFDFHSHFQELTFYLYVSYLKLRICFHYTFYFSKPPKEGIARSRENVGHIFRQRLRSNTSMCYHDPVQNDINLSLQNLV